MESNLVALLLLILFTNVPEHFSVPLGSQEDQNSIYNFNLIVNGEKSSQFPPSPVDLQSNLSPVTDTISKLLAISKNLNKVSASHHQQSQIKCNNHLENGITESSSSSVIAEQGSSSSSDVAESSNLLDGEYAGK